MKLPGTIIINLYPFIMKKIHWLFNVILFLSGIGIIAIAYPGCKKSSDATSQGSASTPSLTTSAVTNITNSSAGSGGTITSDGGLTITARGVCWSTSHNPTISDIKTSDGNGNGSFTSNIIGLAPSTPYYVRAYATNSAATGYGNELTFTTLATIPGTVVDYDGNVYHTKTIGSQVWTVENLKVTHYRNGDPITAGKEMKNYKFPLTEGQYWNYNNDTAIGRIYGHLYNFYAVVDPRFITPAGWHIATDAEWKTLETYLGADSVGARLKETGTLHWAFPNLGATNATGFTALPGGYRDTDGTFSQSGYYAYFWTSTEQSSVNGLDRILGFNIAWMMHNSDDKPRGMSVRCIQN